MMRSPWAREYARRPKEYVWGIAPSTFAREVSELLPPAARVLDLGCGEGRDSVFFASRGFEVTGVDASRAGLRKGERLARERGTEVRWLHGDMAHLALDGSFDLVYSCGSIHYVSRRERDRLFPRLKALTRPNGYHAHIVFTDRIVYREKGEVIDYFVRGELAGAYANWPILRLEERTIPCSQDGVPHDHSVELILSKAVGGGSGTAAETSRGECRQALPATAVVVHLRLGPSIAPMKILGAALVVAIATSHSGATGRECPSGPIADRLDTWSQLYSAFQRYAHCDDGAIAEQFSDSVVGLLARHWESLPEAAALGSKDPAFEAFLLRHIDSTADSEDLHRVAVLAETQCPRGYPQLCTSVRGRVGDAHAHYLRPLEHADAAKDVQEAIRANDLRFLGIAGDVVEVPGAESSRHLHEKYGVRVIEGTSNMVFGREHGRLMGIARRYAREHNALLLKYLQNRSQ